MTLTGNFVDYFIVFWSGVLVSFTPCVYPVLPLTASFIAGINTKGSKLAGFALSLIYVLGLAITYCALAVFAALSGKMFGQIQNSPVLFLIVSAVLLFFALAMFDVVRLPEFGVNVQHKIKTRNFWTVILFGAASGGCVWTVGPGAAGFSGRGGICGLRRRVRGLRRRVPRLCR